MSAKKPVLYGDAVRWGLIEGDALLMLAKLPDACVDAILSDPPYGIGFANEPWDGVDIRKTVATHGEHLSANEAFQRWTQLWAAECRRVLRPGGHALVFGAPRTFHRLVSGIEDAGLEVRDVLMWLYSTGVPKSRRMPDGQGTSLKPAYEPIALARTPIKGSVTANTRIWGTGALNIDATRVAHARSETGYWPANVVRDAWEDGSEWARFFYCAKASVKEREAGCEQLPARPVKLYSSRRHSARMRRNPHRTVKPLSLMRWLTRLIAPPGGVVLDPFTGSGSTGAAAMLEGRQFLGIEKEPEYVQVARARLTHWAQVAAKEGSR